MRYHWLSLIIIDIYHENNLCAYVHGETWNLIFQNSLTLCKYQLKHKNLNKLHLFPYLNFFTLSLFFCQKREIRVSNVDGPWSCDAGLVQKVGSHLWHHQKKNLSLQPVKTKKLSKILTRQLNRKQGLGRKIVFSFLWLVKFEDSKQNGD